ncbi:MAG: oxidoreductase [Nitrospirae bacterium RIFOXYB2_FULL_43_5]|nr:MAG: oxidoreductase [Nitrospirae bacterium GWF2_44_13]OGW32580.1 MAG: oxidoreductase [Nitrospirae bacterium GWD2_44_7]OGW63502.1 MAG: oxidoreductase [Nitrospirae bacterium RIFOXYA2_FULL_44_9]OGW73006.1 MAG: oxidoreductase [Nitrospirae bacterium RIFOXYB2_FULL_43_5]OGW73260.1 MAG: oxidoreductase [Nitrospirae bacterium RIFOXYC2_FULL_44_7]
MQVLVTGGCGYKGTVLVPKLLDRGYDVTVIDTMWFGNYLKANENLKVIKGDIRDVGNALLDNVDTIIHLSSVANDPCGDLDPKLTWEISALATMQLADKAVRKGIKNFIYASSGSVYGIKGEDQVTEDLELKPISEYNKTKMIAERVLLSYSDKMNIQIIRPATVCGYSPRMRLDVSVNMLTMQALTKGEITVFGGQQVRPNIHIDDITDLYLFMIDKQDTVSGIYNAGFENISIMEIAERVTKLVPAKISVTTSTDPRSYRVNSDKLLKAGFSPRKTVNDAIGEIVDKYKEGILNDEDFYYNLKWMKKEIIR